jgi:hypothetical protein
MASVIEIGLMDYFSIIFLFLLVFVGVYAVIAKSGILGEKKYLGSLIAFIVALFVALSPEVSTFVIFVLPWFFVLAFILFFLIFIAKMFGKSDKDVAWAFNYKDQNTPIVTWIIIFVILIVVIGFSHIFGQRLLLENPELAGASEDPAKIDVIQDVDAISEEARRSELATEDYSTNILATLTHPKVLGMLAFIMVALAAVLLLTKMN